MSKTIVGTQVLAVTNAAVVSLTVPASALRAEIVVDGAAVRYWINASNPTPTDGRPLHVGSQLRLEYKRNHDIDELRDFRCIAQTATNGRLHVEYYSFLRERDTDV